MPASTPTQGLPSPPPRTPATPSRSFPYVFAPHLPKLGTAKVRLRSNVFGLFGYIVIWWQASLYGYTKGAVVLLFSSVFSPESVKWAIGSIENILLFIFVWNIVEAIFVIRRAPAPAVMPPTGQTSHTRPFRPRKSDLKFLSSNSTASSPLQQSTISPYLNSSSPYTTPTRIGRSARHSLPHTSQLDMSYSTSSPLALGLSTTSADSNALFGSPLASYLGKHSYSSQAGRPLYGQLLQKLLDADDS